MSKKILLASVSILLFGLQTVMAQVNATSSACDTVQKKGKSLGTLTIGGYGEAVYKYNFFSDNVFRYSHAANYADSKGHGRVDLPHAVIMLGYDFGHGWSFNTEIEFEHGGTESAVEVEAEETGEFEKEIERGGEVALEQFWLQKAFWGGKMNIRAGHIVVPVGGTNNAHLPTQFFGVYRPEGENTIIPCTWHETGLYGNTGHPKRFTYACSRGPLQDGPGANAIWNITNVTRGDRRYHYMTETYARIASQDPDVQAAFYNYFPEYNITGNPETDIYNYLMNKSLPAEMSNDDYVNLMVWHRGLAVPATRNLDDPEVQKGRKIFREIGCASCHRPSWTTGSDRFTDPNGFFTTGDQRLPRYPNQKIWPYTDMVQHRLCMVNDIRTGWCRTTPLWGRGLSAVCTGASDRLHDCRARNVIEAIMWHGNAQSDARWTVEKFRNLSKEERDAVVKFINAI